MVISRWFVLKLRNVSDNTCRENQNAHFTRMFDNIFLPKNLAVCEILWENMVHLDSSQTTIWRMRLSRWLPKDTDTRSEYVIPLAFH